MRESCPINDMVKGGVDLLKKSAKERGGKLLNKQFYMEDHFLLEVKRFLSFFPPSNLCRLHLYLEIFVLEEGFLHSL